MLEFHKPDPLLKTVLAPQGLRQEELYCMSPFVLRIETAGRYWLYNQFTRQGLELPARHAGTEFFSAEEIRRDPELGALLAGWFLKPTGRDETALYEKTAAMMRALKHRQGQDYFVVQPTLGCNARCAYCYEEGVTPASMDRETEHALVAWIDRVRRPGAKIFIHWFGGEPLLGADSIDRILAELQLRGIEYDSGFVTNGSLLTPALADKMAGAWRTKEVQITLDGAEASYLARKRYRNLPDAYRRVLRGLALLAERGVSVDLRYNLDFENAVELPEVLADLADAVPASARKRIWFYLAPLYELRMSERCLEIWKLAESCYPLLREAPFGTFRMLSPGTGFVAYRCMAVGPGARAMVTPLGQLTPCTHRGEGPYYGSVREGVTDPELLRKLSTVGPTRAACRDCPFLPDCSSYSACPMGDRQCREARTLIAEAVLRERVEQALARAAAGIEPQLPETEHQAPMD